MITKLEINFFKMNYGVLKIRKVRLAKGQWLIDHSQWFGCLKGNLF